MFWRLFLFYEKFSKACILYRKELFLGLSLKRTDFFENIGIVLAENKSECKKTILKRPIEFQENRITPEFLMKIINCIMLIWKRRSNELET